MSRKCFGFTWPKPKGTTAANRSVQGFWILKDDIDFMTGLPAAPDLVSREKIQICRKPRMNPEASPGLFLQSLATATFKAQFGDSGLVQLAEAQFNHLRILLER